MKWPSVSLGEVASLERRSLAPEQIESGTNYLGLEHIESGGRIIEYQSVESGELKSNKFMFDPETLLYGKLRPYLAKVCIPDREGCCSTDIIPIRPGKRLDIGYLRHLLLWKPYVDKASSLCSGANLPRISPSTLLGIEIPLPPLEEQRRIAAILDKCHESELLASKAASLYYSLFNASFHSFLRKAEDRESIPLVPLSSVCSRITKGTTPSSLGLPDADGDIPFVRVQDIDKNVLIAESVVLQIPMETHHALSRSMLQSGDILVSIAGTIGRVCEVRSLPPHGANCNQAVAIARPIPDVVRPLFLKCLLSDRPAQKQMRGAGVTGTITNLSLGQLGEIKIPVPSIEAQDKICDQLERLAYIGEKFQNSFVAAKGLSDSLTTFLMSGT
jgi:type I restriction enzyme S subunit